MERTTPVSKGCMSLTRLLGMTFPDADATISTCPKVAQTSATQKTATMVAPMARPIGDGGVSTISKAAGRKASSCSKRRATELALADFMPVSFKPDSPDDPRTGATSSKFSSLLEARRELRNAVADYPQINGTINGVS